ncbi:MAG: signal peptidase I [Alphaproteobacteria bacterium]|nr:MAG: signal peptidase I [Alphaproteobacteria bacterium]
MPETKKKQSTTAADKKKNTAKKKAAPKKKPVKKSTKAAAKTTKKILPPPMTEQELREREEEARAEALAAAIESDQNIPDDDNENEDEENEGHEDEQTGEEDYGLLPVLITAAIIALCFRIFIFQPFNIPSGSMYPNLLVGDYLFVSKYSYGYSRYSFPDWLFVQFKGRIMEKEPQRGDIVVFRQPHQLHVDYIKRIIGMPGDKIQMREGLLYLNDEIVPREFVATEERDENGLIDVYSKYEETLPNGVKHYIYEKSDWEFYDDTREYTVDDDHYFVMGDNRDGSLDSRATDKVGLVPKENLIGQAKLLFFSTEGIGNACPLGDGFFRYPRNLGCLIWHGLKNIRYSRLFTRLH